MFMMELTSRRGSLSSIWSFCAESTSPGEPSSSTWSTPLFRRFPTSGWRKTWTQWCSSTLFLGICDFSSSPLAMEAISSSFPWSFPSSSPSPESGCGCTLSYALYGWYATTRFPCIWDISVSESSLTGFLLLRQLPRFDFSACFMCRKWRRWRASARRRERRECRSTPRVSKLIMGIAYFWLAKLDAFDIFDIFDR